MSLNFIFSAEDRNLMSTVHNIAAGVQDATRQIEANGGDINRVINMIKNGVATLGIGLGFKELVGQIASTRDEFQKLEITFNTLLGSEEKANALMSQLIKTAAITPFSMSSVTEGAKGLLAYGVAAEDINETLIGLGDIAAGLKIPLTDLTYLYGTTITQGRMFTQDLRQFQGRGIPIADEIATILGVTKEKVGDAVTAGKVTSEVFIQAMKNMYAEGGKFGGLMEAQSKSLGGQWENIKDSIEQMFNEIGKSTEGIMNTTLAATSAIVENWQSVLLILGDVAAAYGAQKALVMLDSSFTTAATNYGYDAEIAQLQALLPVKEKAAKTDLEEAEASGLLTKAKAEQIAALREEANVQLQALAAKEAAAKAEEASAVAKAEAAAKEVSAIEEEIEAVQERFTAALASMNAEEAETYATELDTLETMRNEAANLSLAASEEARIAATNTAAASEARETLATQINTAQTASNSAATGILTIAKEKLAAAIAKVNAVMKANQFAIITGAVVALGYAIYKLLTYQTDYQKSLQKVSEATTETNTQIGKETKTLDELKKKLDTAVKGSDEWKSTKDAIVKQFGQYIPQLDEEITKVGSLASAYDDLKRAIQQANAAKGLKSFLDKNDNYSDVESTFREGLDEWKKSTGNMGSTYKAVLEPILRDYSINSAADKDIYTFVQDKFKERFGVDKGQSFYEGVEYFLKRSKLGKFNEAHKLNQTREREIEKYVTDMGIDRDTYNSVRYGIDKPKKETTKDRSYWEQEVKNRKEAYEAILKTDKEGSAKAKKAYDEAVAELNKYNSVEKKSSGKTAAQLASKTAAEEQQLTDLLKKQAEERLRQQQDYEYELWQNRIDLMEEGETKVLAQIQLDNAKELTALKERQESEIQVEIQRQKAVFDAHEDVKASKDKKYAKEVFNPAKDVDTAEIDAINERYTRLYVNLEAKQAKAEQDRLDAAKESMNAYLQEFGNYQQKRLAIQEEYDKKIAEAQNAGERMSLIAQKNKAIADLDYREWIDSGDIALAFGEIENLSAKTIKRLISDMERYRDKVIATFDPDKIQKYENALNNLRKLDTDNSFGIFSNMIPDFFKQRAAAQKQLNDAEENYKKLLNEEIKLQMQLNALKLKISTTVKQHTGRNITTDQAGDINFLESLKSELNAGGNDTQWLTDIIGQLGGVQTQLGEVSRATQGAQKSFLGLQESFASAFEGGAATIDAIDTVVHGVNDIVQGLNGTFKELSSTAEALGADMSEGSSWSQAGIIMQGFADASAGATEAWDSLKSGNIMGVVQGIVKSFTSWIKAFAAFNDAKHERNIQKLQEQIEALDKSYNKLNRSIDEAFSTDASELIEQQNTLLQQQKALIRQQMAEEEAKKKTDKDKIKEYQEQLEEIDEILEDNNKKAKEAIIGEDIKSAISEFADAYSSAWENGTDAASKSVSAVKNLINSALTEWLNKKLQPTTQRFYDKLAEYMKDGKLEEWELQSLDALKAEMNRIAAEEEAKFKTIQDRYKDLDELKEELTDISFDSVRDNFKSQLLDMESDANDFTESFTDMLRSAVIEGLMDNKYDAMLKEWYDEFAEAMNDQTLTDEERDSLRQRYQDIVDQGLSDRNAINEIVGGGAYTQSASSGGWEAMGQDQAEELNGRFTALTELQVISNDLQLTQNNLSAQILATLQGMKLLSETGDASDPSILAIKDMIFLSTGYLEDIAKYTKILITVDARLATLNSTIDRKL